MRLSPSAHFWVQIVWPCQPASTSWAEWGVPTPLRVCAAAAAAGNVTLESKAKKLASKPARVRVQRRCAAYSPDPNTLMPRPHFQHAQVKPPTDAERVDPSRLGVVRQRPASAAAGPPPARPSSSARPAVPAREQQVAVVAPWRDGESEHFRSSAEVHPTCHSFRAVSRHEDPCPRPRAARAHLGSCTRVV